MDSDTLDSKSWLQCLPTIYNPDQFSHVLIQFIFQMRIREDNIKDLSIKNIKYI